MLGSPYWSQIAIWMPLEGSSIDFKNFENFTKIIIFSTWWPAWDGLPWVELARLAQLADQWGWLGCGTAGGGRRIQYFRFYCPVKPNREFILVWPPPIVGSVVSMHLTILLDNERNPEE